MDFSIDSMRHPKSPKDILPLRIEIRDILNLHILFSLTNSLVQQTSGAGILLLKDPGSLVFSLWSLMVDFHLHKRLNDYKSTFESVCDTIRNACRSQLVPWWSSALQSTRNPISEQTHVVDTHIGRLDLDRPEQGYIMLPILRRSLSISCTSNYVCLPLES